VNRADADALLFGDVLACDEVRSAVFVPGVLDAATMHADSLQAETFLQAIAVVEDGRGEDPEEHGPTTLALNRIESKLDLLTTLVGALLRNGDADPVQTIRWSALGVCIPNATVLPKARPAISASSRRTGYPRRCDCRRACSHMTGAERIQLCGYASRRCRQAWKQHWNDTCSVSTVAKSRSDAARVDLRHGACTLASLRWTAWVSAGESGASTDLRRPHAGPRRPAKVARILRWHRRSG
jgi:hypothetical protein